MYIYIYIYIYIHLHQGSSRAVRRTACGASYPWGCREPAANSQPGSALSPKEGAWPCGCRRSTRTARPALLREAPAPKNGGAAAAAPLTLMTVLDQAGCTRRRVRVTNAAPVI